MRFPLQICIAVFGFFLLMPCAHASNPGDACSAGQSGYVQFESGALMICDGSTWNGAMQITSSSGKTLLQVDVDSGTCTAAKLGRLQYNSSASPTWTYCNGTAWTPFQSAASGPGYFVLTSTKWNGNLGGLSGANAKCLTELQTYNWVGKSSAGTLTSARVYAFLCDGTSCNNLKANTAYMMAQANNATSCGWGFVTDANGQGPNTQMYWDENCSATSGNLWSNRGTVSVSLWALTKAGTNHCTNWTSSSSGQSGAEGNAGWQDGQRWNEAVDPCNTTNYLMCVVDP